MSERPLNLKQAAEHVYMEMNELKHCYQRGEIEGYEHGGDIWFDHRLLDEWAQRNLLAAGKREQLRQHQAIVAKNQRAKNDDWRVHSLIRLDGIDLALSGKAKAGIVRDIAALAVRTGLVYDNDGLYGELMAREEIASTAVGEGAAFLHPRFHDPYLFEDTFIAYARSERPVFFGAADGSATRHFFMIGSTDHEKHLHILSRLAVMTHATEFLSILDEATTPEQVVEIVRAAEEGLLK